MPLTERVLAEFAAPPTEYRPHLMWFWNAPLDENEIRRQVREFREAGVYDFYIHPMYGFPVDYLSNAMFEAIGWAVDEARQHGMRFWIYDEYNWPSGAAAGYVFRDNPERRAILLERRQWPVGEPEPDLLSPAVGGSHDGSGTVTAYYEVMQNGVCPFAQWSPFCWGQEGYTDVCDPAAVQAFIHLTHEAYLRRFPDDMGKTIAGVFTDEVSYCIAGPYGATDVRLAWSHGLREHFMETYGYDIASHLDSLLDNVGDYRRVRSDYWRLMTDRLESAYYRQCSEWCERHGMKLTGHLCGEEFLRYVLLFFGDFYRTIRWLHLPGIDCIFPRFNHEQEQFMVAAKSGGSAIRALGRDRLLCETYTGSGWELTPAEMKTIFDKLAIGGVNLLQYMGAYYSVAGFRKVLPGGYPPSHSYQNAYWGFYRQFGDYVARVSMLLAESRSTARVGLLYPTTAAYCEWAGSAVDLWSGKPGPPRFEQLQRCFIGLTNALIELGIDYDYLFEDALAEATSATGVLRTPNADYDVVILPSTTCLSATAAGKLAEYIESGGRAIFVNHLPEWSPDQARAERLARAIGANPQAANLSVDTLADTAPHAAVQDLPGGRWILTSHLGAGDRGPLRAALSDAIPAYCRAVADLPTSVWATRRDLGGTPIVILANTSVDTKRVPPPAHTNALLNPETGEVEALGECIELPPRALVIATSLDEPPEPAVPFVAEHVHELGEARFSLAAPNTAVARWDVRSADGSAWLQIDGARFPQERPVAPGERYELRWRFELRDEVGPIELVTEDLGPPIEVYLNGRAVQLLERCRVWDWLNLGADVTSLCRPGWNELRLQSVTPGWDAPHAPPLTALRGSFAVDDNRLSRLPLRLGAGPWARLGFPYYAGSATYRWTCEFGSVPAQIQAHTDEVAVIAVLSVNGYRLGARLWAPYRWDLSGRLRRGRNVLELDVTSTTANLLGLNEPIAAVSGPGPSVRQEPVPAGLITPLRIVWR